MARRWCLSSHPCEYKGSTARKMRLWDSLLLTGRYCTHTGVLFSMPIQGGSIPPAPAMTRRGRKSRIWVWSFKRGSLPRRAQYNAIMGSDASDGAQITGLWLMCLCFWQLLSR